MLLPLLVVAPYAFRPGATPAPPDQTPGSSLYLPFAADGFDANAAAATDAAAAAAAAQTPGSSLYLPLVRAGTNCGAATADDSLFDSAPLLAAADTLRPLSHCRPAADIGRAAGWRCGEQHFERCRRQVHWLVELEWRYRRVGVGDKPGAAGQQQHLCQPCTILATACFSLGDYVPGRSDSPASTNVRNRLEDIETIDITVIVWDASDVYRSRTNYRVAGFALMRITSFQLSTGTRIAPRFLGYNSACTPAQATPTHALVPRRLPPPHARRCHLLLRQPPPARRFPPAQRQTPCAALAYSGDSFYDEYHGTDWRGGDYPRGHVQPGGIVSPKAEFGHWGLGASGVSRAAAATSIIGRAAGPPARR